MTDNREQAPPAHRDVRPAGAPELFAEFSRTRQIVSVVVIPVVFGVVAAFTLKWAGAAWWAWQGLGVLGAFVAGREHRRWWPAAVRGVFGGLFAAGTVVGLRLVLSGEDVTDFDPVSFPVYAAVASAGLHAAGSPVWRRIAPARRVRS
jgi:hypothetical protein